MSGLTIAALILGGCCFLFCLPPYQKWKNMRTYKAHAQLCDAKVTQVEQKASRAYVHYHFIKYVHRKRYSFDGRYVYKGLCELGPEDRIKVYFDTARPSMVFAPEELEAARSRYYRNLAIAVVAVILLPLSSVMMHL